MDPVGQAQTVQAAPAPGRRRRRVWPVALFVLLFTAPVLNWFALSLIVPWVGGSALHGRAEGDRHLLYYKGKVTKVAGPTFRRLRAYEDFTRRLLAAEFFLLILLATAAAVVAPALRRK